MHYKIRENNDKYFLESNIRKRAHHVERIILMRDLCANKNDWHTLSAQLEEYLKKWDMLYKSDNDCIGWAKKILAEYTMLEQNSEGCNLRFSEARAGNNFNDILMKRRSRRIFMDKPVDKADIVRIIKAGQQAPSSCNRQAVVYVIIEEDKLKQEVAKTVPGGKPFVGKAPVVILVLADKRDYRFPQERFTPYQDAAAAIQNMPLMAESLKLGGCWCSYTSYSSVEKEREIRSLLNIADKYLICGIVVFGHPAQEVCPIPRRNTEEVIFWNKL